MKPILIFSDGGTRVHGNKRGQHTKKTDLCAYAYLVEFPRYPGKVLVDSQAYQGYTNNQMELSGIIFALNQVLKTMPPSSIYRIPFLAVLDSQYIVNAFNNKWLLKWKNQGFKYRKNAKYWKLLYALSRPFKYLSFKWVRGHQDNKTDVYHQGNCFCDHHLNQEMDKLQNKLNK